MSNTTWHFLSNQFEVATQGSYKRANILNSDHLSKLKAEDADPQILALYTRTKPVSEAYGQQYIQWQSAKGTYKGHTQLFDGLLSELSSTKIKEWDVAIQGVFLEGKPEYTILLPNRRGPFQEGGKDQRISAVETLGLTLDNYPPLADTKLEVDAYAAAMVLARDNQQQKEELASMASDVLERARIDLCIMMYGNLGVLMDKYKEDPDMIENFWQLDLIRHTGQGDDDLPETAVTIGGAITDMNTGMPLNGASIKVSIPMASNSSGSIFETFTDVNGLYSLTIDDLPEAIEANLEVSYMGGPSLNRNIYLEPGNDYLNEDFAM